MVNLYFSPKGTFKIFLNASVCLLMLVFFATPSLAQLAAGKTKFLGNVVRSNVPESFSTYWNQITPENSGKWGSVEGTRDTMNWNELDVAYNYAVNNSIPFKQHTLVWGAQEPAWVSSLSSAEQATEVEEWMRLYAERYPATDFIDVVNEPLHVIPSYVDAIGGSGQTGWDWVIWAFEKARVYNPNAKLLLNDYGILGNSKATSDYLVIINLLKDRGLIDGIGVQAHGLEYARLNNVQSSLDKLAETGIPIYVSELELEHADDNTQLGMYQDIFPLLYEHPGVHGVTLWGYLAGEMWKADAYLLGSVNTIGSWTVGTSFAEYTASGSGKVQVHLTNDDVENTNDLEVDYTILDGVTYQAEDMAINTAVWQNSSCGGSYSPWLHCGGYIEFPNASQDIVVRAHGVTGNEIMEIRTFDDTQERLALQWLRNEYFGDTSGGDTGGGKGSSVIAEAEDGVLSGTMVASSRAGYSGSGYVSGFDSYQDQVTLTINLAEAGSFPLVIGYASDAKASRTIKVNGSVKQKKFSFPASASFTEVEFTTDFNAGDNTVTIMVDRGEGSGADIDYIKVRGAESGSNLRTVAVMDIGREIYPEINIYPNPTQNGKITIELPGPDEIVEVRLMDFSGRTVKALPVNGQTSLDMELGVKPGIYILQFQNENHSINKKLIIQ